MYYKTDLTYLKTPVTDRDSGDARCFDSVGACLGWEVPLGVLLGGSTGGSSGRFHWGFFWEVPLGVLLGSSTGGSSGRFHWGFFWEVPLGVLLGGSSLSSETL